MCLRADAIVRITRATFSKKDDFHRYASWDYCYGLAQRMYSRRSELTDYDYDLMALNLAFYLASWGMYRGSSSLLKKSYKIHIEPLKLIFRRDNLWGDTVPSEELLAFEDELDEVYGPGLNTMTETLFTKILLGLTGNVVACDVNCEEALVKLGFGRKLLQANRDGVISWDALRQNGDFDDIAMALHNEGFKNANYPVVEYTDGRYVQTDERRYYPPAKLVDMFLFGLGSIIYSKDPVWDETLRTLRG